MNKSSSPAITDLSDLFITETDLPRIRQGGTNSMITSREEILSRLRAKGLRIPKKAIDIVLSDQKFTTRNPRYGGGVFITVAGIQELINTVNGSIESTWDRDNL